MYLHHTTEKEILGEKSILCAMANPTLLVSGSALISRKGWTYKIADYLSNFRVWYFKASIEDDFAGFKGGRCLYGQTEEERVVFLQVGHVAAPKPAQVDSGPCH
ncbi:hypothetical protein VNO77_26801 [Canavalia gladiata]|uniref:Uncharacterized protein n=1 Tax=Canavalia gladiata TaxID=3824 RepID=A0AAN9Q5W4_CANGL